MSKKLTHEHLISLEASSLTLEEGEALLFEVREYRRKCEEVRVILNQIPEHMRRLLVTGTILGKFYNTD